MLLFLLQFDWEKLRPENLFGGQVLERTPAGLSIVYLIGIAVLILFLLLGFLKNFRRRRFAFEENLPEEVSRKLTTTLANRSLRIWQFVFVFLALFVYGFHVYWTYFADESNEQFQALSYKDLRNRRTNAARLRGWMLDRSGNLGSALAYYKLDSDGDINRTFALEKEMAHLLGTERGTPGLERALYRQEADATPEAWEVLTRIKRPADEQRDVKITIDRDLQAFLAEQLKDKKGAIVVLNPQTGDVLAMYSNPSFNLREAQTLEDFLKLEGDKRNKPFLNRATREYYVPGSTFKTFTMTSAFRAGKQNTTFNSTPEGFIPFRGSRSITDANGGCEPPFGCTTLNIMQAYEASSNQYFAQMAVDLGKERIRETAGAFSILAVEAPEDALSAGFFPGIWNASNSRISNALAPQQSTIVTGKDISAYDVGLEGMGQGYAGQMTPFQMALIAAAPANLEGKLMKPKIEADLPPQMFSQVVSPQQAAQMREIMALVTEGSGGTATRVFANVRAAGIRSGGKTGTAEKQAPVYDERTGKLKTVKKKRRNDKGETIEYDAPVMYERTDSWYISIAPLEKPQLAIAVVVEGGGYGAAVSAPIAARVIMKARDLGLLGEQYKPKAQVPPPTPRTRNRR
ncbi:MAG: Peptidoglycan D,D-transpeptidase MrdA [uncultured Pyrinomonadaceae bacterium]|uniref:Peptidoglycan D,D-transpeptidase MrdA n=1 Tax=uncultured Pyrinomonadaceae bacterium TaxID=2283094 RepID=A0A6J4PYD2_9BACT|nr:MAG: Peptidoglycan D,D-transpeptidase MrdA [uncultured Pyrinomonadaceae bacterium]